MVRAPSPSMSKEHSETPPSSPKVSERSIAISIVRPTTNCSPMIFMACIIAVRITGSPAFRVKFRMNPLMSDLASLSTSTTLPVSIKPRVEAFTNQLSDCPLWPPQSPEEIFSAISLSAVLLSGTRKSDSARHISAKPSLLDRPNSSKKVSMSPFRDAIALAESVTSRRASESYKVVPVNQG